MTTRKFYAQLSRVSLMLLVVLFLIHSFPPFANYWDVSIISMIFYILLSIVMFYFGKNTAGNANKNDFSRVAFASIFGKMMLTVVLVVIYFKIKQPANQNFLLPFFLIYLVYTVFETAFMMKLAKIKN